MVPYEYCRHAEKHGVYRAYAAADVYFRIV